MSKPSHRRIVRVWRIDTRTSVDVLRESFCVGHYFVSDAVRIVVADPRAVFEANRDLMLLMPVAFEAFFQFFLTDLNEEMSREKKPMSYFEIRQETAFAEIRRGNATRSAATLSEGFKRIFAICRESATVARNADI